MQLLDLLLSANCCPPKNVGKSQCRLLVISQAEVHQAREECGSLAREARLTETFESEQKRALSGPSREAEAGLRAQKQMTALEPDLHVWLLYS